MGGVWASKPRRSTYNASIASPFRTEACPNGLDLDLSSDYIIIGSYVIKWVQMTADGA